MADKEPRRRKKNRRDSQKKVHFSDDVRSEDQFFVPSKSEPRDSDQEVEDEPVIHSSHQPSNVAKFVFVILFSGLVVSLSMIFVSLRDVNEGPVDIFDLGHDDHHGEALHDEHIEDSLHDDHDEHEESEVSFEDILPSLGSILSLNNEEVQSPVIPSEATEDKEEDITDYTVEPEVPADQGILKEYIEDTSESPESIEELTSEVYSDTTTSIPYTEDESLYTTLDYSEAEDFLTPSVQPDEVKPTPETFSETIDYYDDISPTIEAFEDNDQDSFSVYERHDITNEADFEIREQLDEIDDMVDKESDDDDDSDEDEGNDEDDDDNDEEEEDEGVEEEFDFWQF